MLPATYQALLIVVFAIVPGFVGIRGFSRRRYRTEPDRDLYAIAGSLVVSAIWIGVVWLVLLEKGDPLHDWGLIPYRPKVLEEHERELVYLALGVICLPYPLGSLLAIVLDLLEKVRWDWLWKALRWTGFFRPPTAWDRAWLQFTREHGAGEVILRMSDGSFVVGAYGRRSQADLSPNARQLFLEQGYAFRLGPGEDFNGDHNAAPPGEVLGEGTAGVYLRSEEVQAVFFLDPEDEVNGNAQEAAEGA
jgi:hypothetical protein